MHGCSQKSFVLCACAHAGDTSVSCLCVCTACSAHGSRCAPLCVQGQAGSVRVCVYVCTHRQALCVHICVLLWAPGLPGSTPGLFPGVWQALLGNTSNPTQAGLRGKALTQQLISIPLHLQRRPRNENPMGTLVGVNKYAIKIRKSKLWTGLFSFPLISSITEILLLNNISVNNLSSVFLAPVSIIPSQAGDPPRPSCRASSHVHAKGCSGGSFLSTPSSAGMKKETMTNRETTQHGTAQANASRVELGLDPGALAALLQQEGLPHPSTEH